MAIDFREAGRRANEDSLTSTEQKVGLALPAEYRTRSLLGEGARADHLHVGVARGDVWKDTGAKVVHMAPNTSSDILAKSICKAGNIVTGYPTNLPRNP